MDLIIIAYIIGIILGIIMFIKQWQACNDIRDIRNIMVENYNEKILKNREDQAKILKNQEDQIDNKKIINKENTYIKYFIIGIITILSFLIFCSYMASHNT